MKRLFGAIGLLCIVTASPTLGCEPTLRPGIDDRTVDVDPFSPRATTARFVVSIDNTSEQACVVFLSAASDSVGERRLQGPSGSLRYAVFSARGGVLANSEDAVDGLQVRARPGRTRVAFNALISPGARVDAGTYEDQIRLSLFDVNGEPIDGPEIVRLAAEIRPRAQVNIAGAAGPYGALGSLARIDLGELTTGETKRVFVQVRANTDVDVTVSSENRSVMKNLSYPNAEGIRYALRFDGEQIGPRRTFAVRSPRSRLAGDSYPLDVRVGRVEGKIAGTYEDIVRVSVIHK